LCMGLSMSAAIMSIVGGYVSLKDRSAVDEVRDHRLRLLQKIKALPTSCINPDVTLRLLDDELRVVESGLEQLLAE
jgi:hypothetical protein